MISVLYVDDEPDLLELGKLFLEEDGAFTVTTVKSGYEALEILKEFTFDAIVSDYQMPEMDGITLLQKIRLQSRVPFILFTGKGREEVVINAINSGVDFYLQKGGDPGAQFAELGHKIIQAVTRIRAEQALHKKLDLIRHTAIASTRFIRLPPDQIDTAITGLLGEIGSQTGVDHCNIAMIPGTGGEVVWTHEWTGSGIRSFKDRLGTISSFDLSWTTKKLADYDTVNVPRVADLPEEPEEAKRLKTWLQSLGLKSFLVLPLTNGPSIIGSLGLGTARKEVSWPEEDIDILRIYCQIIAGALARKAADLAIHDSEELYRTVFESTGTAMMILGEDKIVAVANREMERISGYSRSDIEGKIPWTEFVSSDDVDRMQQYHVLRRANPASVPKNYEFNFLDRNGNKIGTYITVEMIPKSRKSIVSLIDISKEKAAQEEVRESEEKFRNLTEALPEGIYMIQDNRFVYVNPALCSIFGRQAEELKALPDFTEIFPDSERPRVKNAVAERLAGTRNAERYTVLGWRKDGTVFPVTIFGSKTRYKGMPAIIGTVTEADT